MEFGFREPAAAEHYAGALSDVGDVGKRIGVEEDEIGTVASRDQTEGVFGFKIFTDVFCSRV